MIIWLNGLAIIWEKTNKTLLNLKKQINHCLICDANVASPWQGHSLIINFS